MDNLTIREEQTSDFDAITDIIDRAFAGKDYADGDESQLMPKLREQGALTLSLVALSGDTIIGQAAFSPAKIADKAEDWFTLGPVAVLPGYQRQGIGSKLILTGLERLRQNGASGCIVVGDTNYYCRFGFTLAPHLSPSAAYAEHFMIKLFRGSEPQGKFRFHPVFENGSPNSAD
ncbi:MAG: N-acetyltransferase [Gammaproteobacteria bacterium]|nr:N-acetyltransferase [Gammaproteobacteria bacterium]